jgi:hypothetical protein
VSHTHKYGSRVTPLTRKTQVVEVVGNELQVPKADGLALGEFDTEQVVAAGDDGKFR